MLHCWGAADPQPLLQPTPSSCTVAEFGATCSPTPCILQPAPLRRAVGSMGFTHWKGLNPSLTISSMGALLPSLLGHTVDLPVMSFPAPPSHWGWGFCSHRCSWCQPSSYQSSPTLQSILLEFSFFFIPGVLGKGCCEHLSVIIAFNEAAREGEGARFQRKWRPPASAFSHPAGCWQDLGCDAVAWELDPCRAGAGRAAGSPMGQHLLQRAAWSFSTCSWILLQPAAWTFAIRRWDPCNLQPGPFATCSLNLCNLKLEPLQCAAGSFATCCNPTPEGMLFPPLLLFSPAIPKADCSSSPRNQGLICSLFFDSQTAPAIPSSLGHRAWSTASSQALGHDHSYAIHTH